MDASPRGLIEFAVASRALPGQSESGDFYWVKQDGARVTVAVLDGIGHGREAAQTTRLAVECLEEFAHESPITLFERCHHKLRSTRGVVMSLATFCAGDGSMAWLGVGNVEGVLLHRRRPSPPAEETLLLRPGLLGGHLPRLAASMLRVERDDLLIFATDGIRPGFAESARWGESAQRNAERILDCFGRETDDALVLVARYLNGKTETTIR